MSPKRHHYVPILHLKRFVGAAPKGQVWCYALESGATRSATPENTAVQTHFYSMESADGSMNTQIEEYLAARESDAASAYEMLLGGKIPQKNSQVRANFAMFLGLMFVRTPTMRQFAAEVAGRSMQTMNYAYGVNDKAFDGLMKRLKIEDGVSFNPEEEKEFRRWLVDPTNYKMQIAKEMTLPVLDVADALAPILYNMNWTIVMPRHGFFITTDNPLVRRVDPKTRHPVYGDGGFSNKSMEVIFPLSPQRLLLLSWSEGAPDTGVFPREHVERINTRLAAHAFEHIYSHIHHKSLIDLAKGRKGKQQTLKTGGFGPHRFTEIEVPRRMPRR